MRVGIVCPFAWDVPGGVQYHVRDLAEKLLELGHEVSVLAPGDEDAIDEPYVVSVGRALPVRHNGSVARLAFGPVSASRVRRWLREGEFDVLHVHSPISPSIGMVACWAAIGPIVATFHASYEGRVWPMVAGYGLLSATLEKVSARIAVSEEARRTVVQHLGGDAVLIPNGVDTRRFAGEQTLPGWERGQDTVGFIGRLDEPRKGLPVLMAAFPSIAERVPSSRLLVAGPGDEDDARGLLPRALHDRVTFLGRIDEADKAAMLHGVDVLVTPNTGGESFGIVLLEAMAAGTPVVASDLVAFEAVLDGGSAGVLTPVEDAGALADATVDLLGDAPRRDAFRARGYQVVQRYDWDTVAAEIVDVYETVVVPGHPVREDDRQGPGMFAGRLRGGRHD
jgi:phosphatidyl-myo-inositol alpha-mannosyltransferase